MKSKDEIEQKLHDLYEHRLKLRYKKYLSKSFRNCKYNKLVITDKYKLFVCTNKQISNDNIVICNHNNICKNYINNNSREKIEQQFLSEIKTPKLCGQTEPKLAVLLWVLTDEKNIKQEQDLFEKKEFFIWKKIKKMCGLA